jgi:hypothetical protein
LGDRGRVGKLTQQKGESQVDWLLLFSVKPFFAKKLVACVGQFLQDIFAKA